MSIIFVPVICPACGRYSASVFNRPDLDQKIVADLPIRLRCGFDDETWDATASQRTMIVKMCREDDAVRLAARTPWPELSDFRRAGYAT
jgi:hypothetical protein